MIIRHAQKQKKVGCTHKTSKLFTTMTGSKISLKHKVRNQSKKIRPTGREKTTQKKLAHALK